MGKALGLIRIGGRESGKEGGSQREIKLIKAEM